MLRGVGLFSAMDDGDSTLTSPVMNDEGAGVANVVPTLLVAAMR